jgi:hypothetical protein
MRRMFQWRLMTLLLVLSASSACSGTPKLTDDGRLIRDVTVLVGDLDRAYEARDESGLMAGVAAQFPDRDAFRQAAKSTFDRFERIALTPTIDRVHLEGKTATVFLHWDAQWTASGSSPIAKQGTARFVVDAENRPVLTAVLGDNPFTADPASPR